MTAIENTENTEKLKAAHEVLKSEALIKQMIVECKIDAEQLAEFIGVLQVVAEEEQKKAQKAAQLATIQSLIDSGVLDASDLKSLNLKDQAQDKLRKQQEKKWIRFEHDGKEYYINRSTSGKAPSVLDAYMKKTGQTLSELAVKDESTVDHSKVITKEQLAELSKKSNKTQ